MRGSNRHQRFWDKEYKKPEHLAISTEPAEDLQKFTRWLERQFGGRIFNATTNVLDLGCGNGRNLIWLAREFGVHGTGYDISTEAIEQARRVTGESFSNGLGIVSEDLRKASSGSAYSSSVSLQFAVRSLSEPLPEADQSVDVVLDMMSSHVLRAGEREKLREEIWRVLKPGGWFLFKSFMLEEDLHAKRLLRDHPADESNSYIHPELGILEHVWTIDEVYDFFGGRFEIHKIEKSHKHLKGRDRHGRGGVAFRRRTVTAYLEKTA